MPDECIIRHPRLRSLALTTLIAAPTMGAVTGYIGLWGWFSLHLPPLTVVAYTSFSAALMVFLMRVIYTLSTDFGVRIDEHGVQVIRRRVLRSPVAGVSFRWEELGEPHLLSKLSKEIVVPTRGPSLFLSASQAKAVFNHPRWPGPRTFPEDVTQLIESAK